MPKRWDILVGLIRSRGLLRGAEVGVKAGENIRRVLQQCPDFHFVAIDCWDPRFQYQNWGKHAQEHNEILFDRVCRMFPGRVEKFKGYSLRMSGMFDDESFDIVFIDGDHSRAACEADIVAWLPKVRRGGVICGHDYGHPKLPGVKEAVDTFFPSVALYDDYVWLAERA